METNRYMISDAARQVDVEAHVLRYWEEELEMDIPRNEMGHRYYTEEDILRLRRVHEMKENGYGLKAIKMVLHNQEKMNPENLRQPDRHMDCLLREKEEHDEEHFQRFDELLRMKQKKKRRLCRK